MESLLDLLSPMRSPFSRTRAEVDEPVEDPGEPTSPRPRELSPKPENRVEPVQLVSLEGTTFQVHEKALEVLRGAEGDVAVVSCCGRSRQGKSFLLNVLLRKMFEIGDHETFDGFRTSGSTEPCTKGLYLWPEPLTGTKDGRKLSVFFLDSEGVDAYDQTATYSAEVFSMAVLLSSVFVYNSVGAIDESAIDKLSLVCELTRLIKGRPSDADEMPSLVWLLRDFFLDFDGEGGAAGYLETALAPRGSSRGGGHRDEIRDAVKSLFPVRDCVAVARPHNEERELRRLADLPVSGLRREFRDGVEKVYQKILDRVRPKRFGDRRLDGPMLADLVRVYAESINEGAVPTIATAWEGVARAQCEKAAGLARAKYRDKLEAAPAAKAEEAELQRRHRAATDAALAVFDESCAGGKELRSGRRAALVAELEDYFEGYKARRYLEAEISCLSRLRDAEARAKEIATSGGAGDLAAFVASFSEEYAQQQEGLSKSDLLCKFLVTCVGLAAQDGGRRAREAEEREQCISRLREKHAKEIVKKEAALSCLKEVMSAETQHVRIRLNREEAKNKRLSKKVSALQAQLESTTSNVQYTSDIVEKWAKEAKEAARTPPKPQVSQCEDAEVSSDTSSPAKLLCSKFKSTSIRDITNY